MFNIISTVIILYTVVCRVYGAYRVQCSTEAGVIYCCMYQSCTDVKYYLSGTKCGSKCMPVVAECMQSTARYITGYTGDQYRVSVMYLYGDK